MITDVKFAQWCIVELLGHTTIAGHVTEAELFGAKLMRIDIPLTDDVTATQYFGAGSIYRMTPVTEEYARHVAKARQVEPPYIFDIRAKIQKELLLEKREPTVFETEPEDLDPDEDTDDNERPF